VSIEPRLCDQYPYPSVTHKQLSILANKPCKQTARLDKRLHFPPRNKVSAIGLQRLDNVRKAIIVEERNAAVVYRKFFEIFNGEFGFGKQRFGVLFIRRFLFDFCYRFSNFGLLYTSAFRSEGREIYKNVCRMGAFAGCKINYDSLAKVRWVRA
jgi:hypothetical protein